MCIVYGLYLAAYLAAHSRNIHHEMEMRNKKMKGKKRTPVQTHAPGSAENDIIQDALASTQ